MPYKDKNRQKKAQKDHYQRHKSSYLTRNKKRRKKILEVVIPLKEKPCTDCNKKYPYYVMDFDHRKAEEKIDDINRLIRNSGKIPVILNEIKKCDLVCSNCHRMRTHARQVG